MQKISGILPTNSRIATVDLSEAHPVRSGQRAFGQKVAEVGTNRLEPKTIVAGIGETYSDFRNQRLTKDQRNAQIATQMTDAFFKQTKPVLLEELANENIAALDSSAYDSMPSYSAELLQESSTLNTAPVNSGPVNPGPAQEIGTNLAIKA